MSYMGYDSEEEYLDSLKQEDSYHFSIPFEYIEKNYGDDNYDIATLTMEIDVQWDENQHGYEIRHYVPEMYKVDPEQGNGDEESFYEFDVYPKVLNLLESYGIGVEIICVC